MVCWHKVFLYFWKMHHPVLRKQWWLSRWRRRSVYWTILYNNHDLQRWQWLWWLFDLWQKWKRRRWNLYTKGRTSTRVHWIIRMSTGIKLNFFQLSLSPFSFPLSLFPLFPCLLLSCPFLPWTLHFSLRLFKDVLEMDYFVLFENNEIFVFSSKQLSHQNIDFKALWKVASFSAVRKYVI